MWATVLERFERDAPACVMARLTLERALPPGWVDEVFEAHRGRQYARELLFSTVVELMALVSLGLRPSLHAAARRMGALPVSLAALYGKVNRTEPAVLRALVRGGFERLAPVAATVGHEACLPGWEVRVLDGNHLPASEKRLAPLRGLRGAALPGHTLVAYDPDTGLVADISPSEDAYRSERVSALPLLEGARPGQAWIADRHFCTAELLGGWQAAGAGFVVREHARHPRLAEEGEWRAGGRTETGEVREQSIEAEGQATAWRRVELALDVPTEAGERVIRLWSNLPAEIDARRIAGLYRTRWTVEGMFQRLECALHGEIASLGHPRAALLGFAAAVLAYNVLSLMQRCVERAHRTEGQPRPEVSTYHLAWQVRGGYEGMLIALPPEHRPSCAEADPVLLAERLLQLARRIDPRRVAASKRGPKIHKPKPYVDSATARAHTSTARVLAHARARP
jgi:IS4 transposase